MNFRSLTLLVLLAGLPLAAGEISLQLSGIAGRDGVAKPAVTLNASAFAALPHAKITVENHTYEGVPLHEILRRAGQPMGEELRAGLLARYIMASAHDGYRVIFSLPEVDPVFGNNGALVVDMIDGHPLPENRGPLSLVVPGEKRHARWVWGLERIEVMSAPDPIR